MSRNSRPYGNENVTSTLLRNITIKIDILKEMSYFLSGIPQFGEEEFLHQKRCQYFP